MDSNDFSLAEDMEGEEKKIYLQTYKQRFLVKHQCLTLYRSTTITQSFSHRDPSNSRRGEKRSLSRVWSSTARMKRP
jgi:hypothetical protein